jgi:hypothetical protein
VSDNDNEREEGREGEREGGRERGREGGRGAEAERAVWWVDGLAASTHDVHDVSLVVRILESKRPVATSLLFTLFASSSTSLTHPSLSL